jgi:hypothetical protein
MADTFDGTNERRQRPRVDLLADLHGNVVALDERIQVTQLSIGGMTVEASVPLSTRLQHDFRISDGSSSIQVRGRIVHSRVEVGGDAVTYVAGVEFIDPTPEVLAVIGRIIERAGG